MTVSVPQRTPVGVIYCRVVRTAPGTGIEQREIADQLQAAHELAAARMIPIVTEFVDVGISGSKIDRPGLQLMLDSVREGRVTHCFVEHIHRLSRTVAGVVAIERELERHGVSLIAWHHPSDVLRRPVRAIGAGQSRRQITVGLRDR